MPSMLELAAHLPSVAYAPGDIIVAEGGTEGGLWVLESGALNVRKGGVLVNSITTPGALIGEISLLLSIPFSATVEASTPTVMRYAVDGQAFLSAEPAILRLLAVGLAERLNFVTSYLADLKHQYGDAPGLSMVSDVLRKLSQRQAPPARSGSARDPDPEY
jgi:CRP/FNR family cyclic AMP-dependent transcriptional regulator